MDRKLPELTLTLGDWRLHLTTLFTDVRLKNYLEFRTADSQPGAFALAVLAFWAGVLYDSGSLRAALERLSRISHRDILEASEEAAYKGLQGRIAGELILDVARDVASLAALGLARLERATGRYSPKYLDPIRDLLEQGKSKAEEVRERWKGGIEGIYRFQRNPGWV